MKVSERKDCIKKYINIIIKPIILKDAINLITVVILLLIIIIIFLFKAKNVFAGQS